MPTAPGVVGLLPWAWGAQTRDYYWLTEGIPDKWPIVTTNLTAEYNDEYKVWHMPLTTFLARLFRKDLPFADSHVFEGDVLFEAIASVED
jgi:hypothetical protein